MKNSWLLLIIFAVFLLIASIVVYTTYEKAPPSTTVELPSPVPTQAVSPTLADDNITTICTSSQIAATLTLSPAAGSVYGKITIQNTSDSTCEIQANNSIQVNGIENAQNVTVTTQGENNPQTFILAPDDTIYSQLRYPNGPQCTRTRTIPVEFSYKISDAEAVTLSLPNNTNEVSLRICQSQEEQTEITVWNISTAPTTP